MAGSAQSEEGTLAEINVTPMIDVLLSLLIIFMVTAGKTQQQQPLTLPQDQAVETPSTDDNSTLLVTLHEDGTAELGNAPLAADRDAMVTQFKASPKAQNDNKIAILAEKKVPYGRVIDVMSAARESGIASVGLASDRL